MQLVCSDYTLQLEGDRERERLKGRHEGIRRNEAYQEMVGERVDFRIYGGRELEIRGEW